MQYGDHMAGSVTSFRYGTAGSQRPLGLCYEEADPVTAFGPPPRPRYEEADPLMQDAHDGDSGPAREQQLFFITSANRNPAEDQLIHALAAPLYARRREDA